MYHRLDDAVVALIFLSGMDPKVGVLVGIRLDELPLPATSAPCIDAPITHCIQLAR